MDFFLLVYHQPVEEFISLWVPCELQGSWSKELSRSGCRLITQNVMVSMAILGSDSLEVPTIFFKAYFLGLCKEIYPQNMARNMVQHLQFRILEFPLMVSENGNATKIVIKTCVNDIPWYIKPYYINPTKSHEVSLSLNEAHEYQHIQNARSPQKNEVYGRSHGQKATIVQDM